MLITKLGVATTLLSGVALGFCGFAILTAWIRLFSKSFDSDSRCFWPLFWVHMLVWVVGVCVVPYDLVNDSIDTWGWPFLIYFCVSPLVIAILQHLKK